MLIASAMSPSMAVTVPRCSPMDSVGTVASGLHSLPLSASSWVLPTGRERVLTHRALQWSPGTRDPHRDTLWQAPAVCGSAISHRMSGGTGKPSTETVSCARKLGQPLESRARIAVMALGALPTNLQLRRGSRTPAAQKQALHVSCHDPRSSARGRPRRREGGRTEVDE